MIAASASLRGLVDGPSHLLVVSARSASSALVDVAGRTIVIEGRDGLRLPCALAVDAVPRPGTKGAIGDGLVDLGQGARPPGRWWDPAIGAVDPARLHFDAPAVEVPAGDDPARLVGLGPGSTPAGDDVLAGWLLGLRVLGHRTAHDRLWAAIEPLLRRTTALSATLLRHAAAGEVAAPVRRFLAGTGEPSPSELDALAGLGGTSGRHLLHGLATAGRNAPVTQAT